jgi:hypothetical protein
MDQNVRIDVTKVAGIDPRAIGTKTRIPRQRTNLPGEQSMIEAGIKAYAATHGTGSGVLLDALDFKSKPSLTVTTVGSIAKAPTRPCTDFTIAAGPSISEGAGVSIDFAGGLYFWNKPLGGEVGLWGSIGVGAITNVGASLVAQIYYLFGPAPALLAGESWLVGVDIGGKLVTGGGYLVFADSWPPQWIGVSFAIGVGVSILPYDIQIQGSHTATTALKSW